MSEKVVHFENYVSTSDEQAITGESGATNEPFTETTTISTENHLSYNDNEEKLKATDKWRSVGRRIQSAMCIKNTVQPVRSRRKSIWRTPTETIDPFIQKFSTRSDNRKTTPPKRTSKKISHKVSIENNLQTIAESQFQPNDSDILSDDVDTGYRGALPCSIRTVFAPEGLFIYSWSYFVAFSIRYNLWVLITRIAFPKAQSEFKNVWLVFDYICDLIYFIDMLISFRTGYLDQGILVTEPGKIAASYIKSKRFLADILSLFPTDFFHVFYSVNLPLLRLNRLIKSYKSLGIKDIMESHTNYPTFYRVFFLLHLMFVLINWNAGIYFMISRAEGFGTNQWVYVGNGSLYQQYLKSLYWSTLTLTAIGDLPSPATNYEYIYTIACYLCGVFMFATIVGNAGNIIVNSNAGRMEFERQRESTKTYMQKNKVPKDLQRRVLMWYDYTWNRGRIGNSSYDLNTLTLLPDKLKTEIALHVNLETLSKVTFLQKCQPEFLHDLVLKMKLRIFTPGDYICRHGEVAREMYVIINGKIEVVGDSGQVLKVLSGGDFFGEIGILSLSEGQNKRTADIRTVGYVECFVLSKEDVLSATRDFPEAQAVLAEYGRRRLEGQTTCKDPRLVDMEDCKPVNSIPSLPSVNGSIPQLSSESLKPTFQLSKSIRTSRAGLLDPIDTRPSNLPENTIDKNIEKGSIPSITNTEDYDDVIMKMMTSSCQEVVSYVRELWKRKEELKKKETDVKLEALKEELTVRCERIDQMQQLISAQEAELQAWREVVHELEDKRMEDTRRIEALVQDNQTLNAELQRCSCGGQRRGRTGLQLDTNDTLC